MSQLLRVQCFGVSRDGVGAPNEIGRGERLWRSPDKLRDRFHLESVASPSGVTHLLFWRRYLLVCRSAPISGPRYSVVAAGGSARIVGSYSSSWVRPSNVRLLSSWRATSG